MKKYWFLQQRIIGVIGLTWALALMLEGCKADTTPSLYDPSAANKPAPVIDTIISATPTAYAGVTMLTMKGQNFSAKNDENSVFFGSTLANVITSSATQLTLRAPILPEDTLVSVKVSVFGAELFSNAKLFKLILAVRDFDSLKLGEEPWGTAVDAAGNFYISIVADGKGAGVKKFAPNGTRSDFSPASVTKWTSLKFGPNNALYGVLGLKAIFQLNAGVAPSLWVGTTSGIGSINDFAFDAQGNIWAAGSNTSVYRVTSNKDIKPFPLDATIRSVRINNGYVYFAGRTYPDSLEKIIRYQIISSDSLGPQDVYFNFSASSFGGGGKSVYSMAFTSQGDLFVGTDRSESIIVVHPGGTAEEFYTGLLPPTIHILVWGEGTELLGVRGTAVSGAVGASNKIIRINAQVTGAP